uniref:Uncharacterized protein n=1 Tax=Oryza barthii TaxID=65489 RepID=A0A0D3HK25_9ORYZ
MKRGRCVRLPLWQRGLESWMFHVRFMKPGQGRQDRKGIHDDCVVTVDQCRDILHRALQAERVKRMRA